MIIKLTNTEDKPILIGTESIIDVVEVNLRSGQIATKIKSRGAMVETNIVKESVEEIFDIINKQTK